LEMDKGVKWLGKCMLAERPEYRAAGQRFKGREMRRKWVALASRRKLGKCCRLTVRREAGRPLVKSPQRRWWVDMRTSIIETWGVAGGE